MSKLKEMNGRYYQECKVVMLDTDKKAPFYLDKVIGLSKAPQDRIIEGLEYQHLYFLSNEKIKGEDWYYDPFENKIKQCLSQMVYTNTVMRKVIATTDISLGLPKPSKKFTKAYIKAYNEGKPITKVLVEYIYPNTINFGNCIYKEINGDGSYYELINGEVEKTKSLNELINLNAEVNFRLKVNSSNEITIKKIKDSYTREEVIDLLEEYRIHLDDFPSVRTSEKYLTNWIEKYL